MERPTPATVAAYEAALPADPRVVRSQMFGHPCAFENGNMFFGTFAQSLVARVGEARTASLLAEGAAEAFEPMPGRPWRDYVRVGPERPPGDLVALAREALAHTAALPPKATKAAKAAPKAAR